MALEYIKVITRFLEGDTVWVLAFVRDENKAYVDPTTIKVSIYDPDGEVEVDAEAMTQYESETGMYEYYYHKGESAEAMDEGVWRGIVTVIDGSGDDAKVTTAPFSFEVV